MLQARNPPFRLGPPPPPRRGVEKPEGPSALQPTTENRPCVTKCLNITARISEKTNGAFLIQSELKSKTGSVLLLFRRLIASWTLSGVISWTSSVLDDVINTDKRFLNNVSAPLSSTGLYKRWYVSANFFSILVDTPSITAGIELVVLRSFLIRLEILHLLSRHAWWNAFLFKFSANFLFFLICIWYAFLVHFIILCNSAFRGRPAEFQVECQNKEQSLKGCTSSFQNAIGDFLALFCTVFVIQGKQSSAEDSMNWSKMTNRSSHFSLWPSEEQLTLRQQPV